MVLTPGTRFANFEILSLLGAGGMGEVYRARDIRLNRDVALKVLPEIFSVDRDRLARFEREAQVLASLSHSNIGAIHGLEEAAARRALVLELVEGPTLAERIAEGPLPPEEALLMWRGDGRELFYYTGPNDGIINMKAVPLTFNGSAVVVGTPQSLFDGRYVSSGPARGLDVSADGKRFLMIRTVDPPPAPPSKLVLVQNFADELTRRVPAGSAK